MKRLLAILPILLPVLALGSEGITPLADSITDRYYESVSRKKHTGDSGHTYITYTLKCKKLPVYQRLAVYRSEVLDVITADQRDDFLFSAPIEFEEKFRNPGTGFEEGPENDEKIHIAHITISEEHHGNAVIFIKYYPISKSTATITLQDLHAKYNERG